MSKLTLTDETDFIITLRDVGRTGHCAKGIKAWADSMDMDFRHFARNGVSAKFVLETGDGQAEQVVLRVWEKRNG